MKKHRIVLIIFSIIITGYVWSMVIPATAFAGEDEEFAELMGEYDEKNEQTRVSDPLFRYNHAVFTFNDKVYNLVLRPTSKGYKVVVPREIRSCVGNFFTNLLFPVRFVNTLLQGSIRQAGIETEIFLLNTVVGGLGLARIAQETYGLKTSDEDFGQTLGRYHVGPGIYIVWPFLGPSTLRDSIGMIGDSFLYPPNYLKSPVAVIGSRTLYTINSTSYRLDDYDTLKKGAIDPYIALKNGYIQQRQEKIKAR